MKNIIEVLRNKEQELHTLQGEIEALRLAIRLVSEDGDNLTSAEGQVHSVAPTGTLSESRLKEINAGSTSRRQFP